MKSFTYTITDPVGIHARPAGILVKAVKPFQSTCKITKNPCLHSVGLFCQKALVY